MVVVKWKVKRGRSAVGGDDEDGGEGEGGCVLC